MLYFNSKAAYKVLESPGKRPRKGPESHGKQAAGVCGNPVCRLVD